MCYEWCISVSRSKSECQSGLSSNHYVCVSVCPCAYAHLCVCVGCHVLRADGRFSLLPVSFWNSVPQTVRKLACHVKTFFFLEVPSFVKDLVSSPTWSPQWTRDCVPSTSSHPTFWSDFVSGPSEPYDGD